MTRSRLEAFSDGVFAIAITLLVIELRPPEAGNGQLAHELWLLWPNYAAYATSFLVIGVMWVNHHRMFDQVVWVDTPLLMLNLLLLFWAALIPFPTAVVADYLNAGNASNAHTALALYGAVILGAAISFVCLFGWITHDERILGTRPPATEVRAARLRFSVGLLGYSIALGLSYVSAPLALATHAAMALYYAFDQSSVTSAS